jgi:hypothetical protein
MQKEAEQHEFVIPVTKLQKPVSLQPVPKVQYQV